MTTKEKKRFWAKVLAFMLVASMMLSNLTVSTTFAAAVDETAAAEESAEDADKTIETVPEEPKADAPETEEPEADTLKEEELKTDASKEDVSEEENSEDKKAEVEESEETSDEKNKEDEVHLEDNQEGNQENDANQEKVTEEEGKDAASEDDKAADLDENGIAIDDSKADEEEVLDEEELLEEVPAEVQAFLDAVAQLPKEITADNLEEVRELLYGPVSDAYEVLLGTEYEKREDVQIAVEVMISAFGKLDDLAGTVAERYVSGITIYYWNNSKPYINMGFLDATSITKNVGETGIYYYCPYDITTCGGCGDAMLTLIPDMYAVTPSEYSVDTDGIILKESIRFRAEKENSFIQKIKLLGM
ncbi:hypothetical protein VV089_00260 [Candidatus Merdisoma sp. JLR.KK011]|uniref:hypothetical protein n=1 Tax=Candidatus Merdisoma sp. JLR.KK011 TaxID=3114299 RepID=UPI002FF278A1